MEIERAKELMEQYDRGLPTTIYAVVIGVNLRTILNGLYGYDFNTNNLLAVKRCFCIEKLKKDNRFCTVLSSDFVYIDVPITHLFEDKTSAKIAKKQMIHAFIAMLKKYV